MKTSSHAAESFCATTVFNIDPENYICYLDKALSDITSYPS